MLVIPSCSRIRPNIAVASFGRRVGAASSHRGGAPRYHRFVDHRPTPTHHAGAVDLHAAQVIVAYP
jgi:hypothetical protein